MMNDKFKANDRKKKWEDYYFTKRRNKKSQSD